MVDIKSSSVWVIFTLFIEQSQWDKKEDDEWVGGEGEGDGVESLWGRGGQVLQVYKDNLASSSGAINDLRTTAKQLLCVASVGPL